MRSKQLLLSAFVVVTFVLYSLQQRHEGLSAASSLTPPPAAKSTSQTAATTSGSTSTSSSSPTSNSSPTYKDGSYTGAAADAFYGNIQVQAVIRGGKIVDVVFLQRPDQADNSVAINQQADPWLKQEAIQAQSARVDIISGATDSSQAFIQSLSSALQKAQNG